MRGLMLRLLALATLLAAIDMPYQPAAARPAYETQVDLILQAMPLDQRVGQLFMVSLYGEELTDPGKAFLRDMMPGAVAMFSYNGTSPQAITDTINAWQSIATQTGSRVPLLVGVDQEGGPVTRLTDGFTPLPWGAALGAMPPDDTQAVGKIAAEELSAAGITMDLAPVADVRTVPDNLFMEPRMFGSNPDIVAAATSAYLQ